MDVLISFILVVLVMIVTSWVGYCTLKQLGVSFGDKISTAVAGLMFIELLGFLFFIAFNSISRTGLWPSLLPFIGLFLYQLYQNRKGLGDYSRYRKPSIDIYSVVCLVGMMLLLYSYIAWPQLEAVLLDEGVIYQDVIYHVGITNAFFELGYPIKNVQYAGGTISYHIFTHFVAAKMSFISGLASYKVYVLIFTTLSICLVSLLLYSVSRLGLKQDFNNKRFLLVGFVTLFGAHLMGLGISSNYFSSFFFSYSYQWQLIIFLLIISYLIKSQQNTSYVFSNKDYGVLLLVICLAIVTKGSSLPLLLSGFGLMFLTKFIVERKINVRDVGFLGLTTFISVLVYLLFFTSTDGADFTSFIGFNDFLTKRTLLYVVLGKLGIQSVGIGFVALMITVISFRYYLIYKLENTVVSFATGIFISGLLFFIFYSNNPNYFLFPAVFLTNLVLILYILKNRNEIPRVHRVLLTLAFILSVYPLSSLGFNFKKKLVEKQEQYYPINKDRLELYHWIEKNTPTEAIIFTPSVYSTDDFISDNYYPAAISKRVFYMGGFRFGNTTYISTFKEREALVNTFSLENEQQIDQLQKDSINIILIEGKGNKINYDLDEILKNENKIVNYDLRFQNSEGVILSFKSRED